MDTLLMYVPISAVIFVVICFLVLQYHAKKEKKVINPGTVLLHQFKPSDLVPSGSPACAKLETFLRMTKIPYENAYGLKFSKKGKLPWIEFNGQAIADSNFCIWFLMKEFRVDVDSHLSDTERAMGHTIRTMLEENTYWTLVHYRFFSDFALGMREKLFGHLFPPLKYLVFYMVRRKVQKDMWNNGMGRFTEEEIYDIAERDLLAVSEILGLKNFLFGDKPWVPCLVQGWHCGESTRPPPMWPRFDFQTPRHMWLEFVGSLQCTERIFSGYSSFPLSSKTNT